MSKDKIFFFIQSIVKYNSFNFGIKLRSILYRPFFKKFGKNIQIKDGVTFKYPSDIKIGDNTIIGEYCYFVGKSGLSIGKNVLIGSGTKIITSEHRYEDVRQSIYSQGLTFKPVKIGNDVWFGFDVKVLAGVVIPNGCIVAINSVVNKPFIESDVVLAGTPAKIVKKRIG